MNCKRKFVPTWHKVEDMVVGLKITVENKVFYARSCVYHSGILQFVDLSGVKHRKKTFSIRPICDDDDEYAIFKVLK